MKQIKRISDFTLEQYLLKELPYDKHIEIEQMIQSDRELQKRVKSIIAEDEAFFKNRPAHLFCHTLLTVSAPKSPRYVAFGGNPTLTFCTLLLLLLPFVWLQLGGDSITLPEITRFKGADASIRVYKKREYGSERLLDSSRVKEGDLVQIQYFNPHDTLFGAIISYDGNGVVTYHLGEESSRSILLKKGLYNLDFSYELDDAPHFEKFYFMSSQTPFDLPSSLESVPDESGEIIISHEISLSKLILLKYEE